MAVKTEQVLVNILSKLEGGHEVGTQYLGVTSEAGGRLEQAARELAINALCVRAIQMRMEEGQPVPEVLVRLVEARTFTDFS